MWPVALIPVTDRIPLVKSMKASVKRTEINVPPPTGAHQHANATKLQLQSP